jgi:hypothetical protein
MAKPAVPSDETVFDIQAQLNAAAAAQTTPPRRTTTQPILLTKRTPEGKKD